MLKNILYTFLLTISFHAVQSQTLDDAERHIYYQRYETAKHVLQSVIKTRLPSPDAWYLLGEIYLKQDEIDSARNVFLDGTGFFINNRFSKKDYPRLFIGWAHMLLNEGEKTEATEQMKEILKESKYKNSVALLAAARANIDSKNGDRLWAIELLNKAKKRNKKNAAIYTAMGDAYRKLHNGAKAVQSYDEAIRIDPSYAEAMFKKGLIYKTQKNQEVYLDRFTKAYNMDTTYTPALYELYYYYFNRNTEKATRLLNAYFRNADPSPSHLYMLTDLQYITGKYREAIKNALTILQHEKENTQPRIYKLLAYCYDEGGDSLSALHEMKLYFEKQPPADYVSKDFEFMANLQEKVNPDKSVAVDWYKKALYSVNDPKEKLGYMVSLANLQKELGNREKEAAWRELVYTTKQHPGNMDVYNWAIALYAAEKYERADSVFAIYEEKYPDEVYGYLWRARCNALLDTSMEKGLAVPYYEKMVTIAEREPIKNKSLLIGAYGYLGAYEANVVKNHEKSLAYFDKIVALDPENKDALKYSALLKKWIESGTSMKKERPAGSNDN